jgi:hypothetical protein
MRAECMPQLSLNEWENIAKTFQDRSQFPHCLGAVDGKHVRLTTPIGSMFYNYKGYSSIVLMAVADANYRFIYVDIGGYGKDNDSAIWQRTDLWKAVINGEAGLPQNTSIPESDLPAIPYFFVGDEAFGLHKNLLVPYGGRQLPIEKRIFNYRLIRARRFVECTFEILSNKWRILHRAINVAPDFATDIVKACVILHNFVWDRDGFKFNDTTTIVGLVDHNETDETGLNEEAVGVSRTAIETRNLLTDYFITRQGEISWQYSKV